MPLTIKHSRAKAASAKAVLVTVLPFLVAVCGCTNSQEPQLLGESAESVLSALEPNRLGSPNQAHQLLIAPFDQQQAITSQNAWSGELEIPVEFTNCIGMRMRLLPPGEFLMGEVDSELDAPDQEKPQHKVRITKPFYLCITEVTQGQYERVIGMNPSRSKNDPQFPVSHVSWEDAAEFCVKLSQREGWTYRLPTEAEWEYACRAGTPSIWWGDGEGSDLTDYAWFDEASGPHAVAQKKPNMFGLYDMHGNVSEWCLDWYDADYYAKSPTDDPKGPSSGEYKVTRGGDWGIYAWICRAGCRSWDEPSTRTGDPRDFGFRVILDLSSGKNKVKSDD